ncbi:MAG: UvrD-helicase domain-containing protein, partial [Anaerolineales bacterium]|nr:UvrD-helicase domain-containing protein [Anaerolineales bacterium]
ALIEGAPDEAFKRYWSEVEAGLDGARIGTIHSLCAEILRAHPAEAAIDPRFSVLEEGLVQALRVQVVADAMAWVVDQDELLPLFEAFSAFRLEEVLQAALEKRLDVLRVLVAGGTPSTVDFLHQRLGAFFGAEDVAAGLDLVSSLAREGSLEEDAGEKLAVQMREMLLRVARIRALLDDGRAFDAAGETYLLRRENLKLGAGKNNSAAKTCLAQLQAAYDDRLNPLVGGKQSKDPPPSRAVEAAYGRALPALMSLIRHVFERYHAALDARGALDFDDLEQGALELLQKDAIRKTWQNAVDALLVDEFQDTNTRQQDIVQALSGAKGGLFVVGDARQSIYRFRGADVSMFRSLRRELASSGGAAFELDTTFRAHVSLLQAMEVFLKSMMGEDEALAEAYEIPYSGLKPHRSDASPEIQPPYLEIIVGWGESAAEGRRAAAERLAAHLRQMRASGEIKAWDDVALLFRASTAFPVYELALEEVGIPFVTVAGRGFFDRPEVRDVLNALTALSMPWDDLALAGWLRSPVVGLRDDSLVRLCRQAEPLAQVLAGDLSFLPAGEMRLAEVFYQRFQNLREQVDRVPVSVLLEELLRAFGYRVLMAGINHRMLRNLEKLVEDARASGLIRIGEFLDYIQTLRDVGVREGEAPMEVSGAIQLMTVHKSKGLEFPVVVVADAGYRGRSGGALLLAEPEYGLSVQPDRIETPLLVRYAGFQDVCRDEAENKRLLYVAATRAREKLILNGHLSMRSDSVSAAGWLGSILASLELQPEDVMLEGELYREIRLENGIRVGIDGQRTAAMLALPEAEGELYWPESNALPIAAPLQQGQQAEDQEEKPPQENHYARLLGSLTHAVLQAGVELGWEQQQDALRRKAPRLRFESEAARARAVSEAGEMLQWLRDDELWHTLQTADERHHEIPFVPAASGRFARPGKIDVLYRRGENWFILDFKTDGIDTGEELQQHVDEHAKQVSRYADAVAEYLDCPRPAQKLCFLNFQGRVHVVDIGPGG